MKNKYNHAIKKMNSTHRGISFIIIFSFMLIVNIVLFVNYIRLKRDINHKESYYKEHLSEYNILFQEANSQQRTLEETKQLKEQTQINIKRTEDELESFEKENNKLIDSLKDLQITLDALSPEIIKQASLKSALEDVSDLYEHTKDSIYQSLNISNSYIIKGYDEIDLLKTYLGSNAKLSLCYSSAIDGISSESFHKRCDGIPHTLTLYKSTLSRFGGYASEKWDNREDAYYKQDRDAFVFNLDSKRFFFPSRNGNTLLMGKKYFPCFGELDFAMTDKSSYTKFPVVFQENVIDGVNFESKQISNRELTGYDEKLKMEMVEVYTITYN